MLAAALDAISRQLFVTWCDPMSAYDRDLIEILDYELSRLAETVCYAHSNGRNLAEWEMAHSR
jgi:hypothetical protein